MNFAIYLFGNSRQNTAHCVGRNGGTFMDEHSGSWTQTARSAEVNRLLSMASTVCVLLCCLSQSYGQSKICIIDMAKVFKANTTFANQMQALKSEADAFQMNLQTAQQQLAQLNEELRMMDASKPEYRTKESELAQLSANLEVDRRTKVRELMQRESQAHFEAYAEITQLIDSYCKENGVSIVVRFNSEPMRLDKPETIEDAFNNSVVYFAPQRDITNEIVARLSAVQPQHTNR